MLPVRPWLLGVFCQLGHQVSGADGIVVTKGQPNVLEQLDADGVVLGLAREHESGLSCSVWPIATDELGDGQEGTPVVSGAIVQYLGDRGVGIDQLVEVVRCPSGRLAP